jgi:hypothetical protein
MAIEATEEVKQPKTKEVSKVDVKQMIYKGRHDKQFLFKMTKDDVQKLKEVVEYFQTDKSKALRAGIYLMHDLMLEEKKQSNNQKPKK